MTKNNMAMALTSPGQKLMQEIYDQFLICKICYETYRKPKTLLCLHIFCAECLEKHLDAEAERSYRYLLYSRYVSCPICRKKTELPSGGIRRLPDNFLVSNLTEIISRRRGSCKVPSCEICKSVGYKTDKEAVSKCLECSKMLCTSCVDLHKRTKVTRNHSLIDTAVEKSIGCKVHSEEVVRFYCEPCEMCICILCTFQEHKGHDVQSFTEGMQKYQHSLDSLVGKCNDRITCIKDHLNMIQKCETQIRSAEDEIRDTAIESITAIRKSEKQMVEALYEVYGEDTIQFLKEKHVLQDILDNLLSTCSLTEIILKDKSIELLLLRREIQDKLEVLLQGKVHDPPARILRQVNFNPGPVVFGQLAIDGGKETRGDLSPVRPFGKGCDVDVQTEKISALQEAYTTMDKSIHDFDSEIHTQTEVDVSSIGTDMLGYGPEMGTMSSNTCPLDTQDNHTMTDSVSVIRRKVQTDPAALADKGVETNVPILWEKFTNTPQVNQVDRSTLTTKQNVTDSHTDTKGLVNMASTSTGHDIVMTTIGTVTENINQINKAINTIGPEIADKITSTPRIVRHEKCLGTPTVTTFDMGLMARFLGVDKGVATRPIVLIDTCVGENNVQTSDRGTDTIWKGVRRVSNKYTMHDLLYSTKETDTGTLISTRDRASSPCEVEVAEGLLANSKRKMAPDTLATKRICIGGGPISKKPDMQTQSSQTDMDMTSVLSPPDVRHPLLQSRVLSRQPSTEDKGVATPFVYTLTKETSTKPTRMKEKGTGTYVQALEKATYMIQPVILSTGTNTPLLLTSDKKVDTELETRDSWTTPVVVRTCDGHTCMDRPYMATVSTDTKGVLTVRDIGSDPKPGDNASTGTMTPIKKVRDSITETSRMSGIDATTSTSVKTIEKGTTCETKETVDNHTMTFIETVDVGVLKRPHSLTRSTSTKKIKTLDSEMVTEPPSVRHQGAMTETVKKLCRTKSTGTPVVNVTDSSTGTCLLSTVDRDSSPYRTRTVERYTSPMRVVVQNKNINVNIKTPTSEKTTSTFKIELKNRGVGTPIVRFIDRDSSPVKDLEPKKVTMDRATYMPRIIKLSKQTATPVTPTRQVATSTKQVQYTDRESSPVRFPTRSRGTLATVATSTKEASTVHIRTGEQTTNTDPATITDSGVGSSSVIYYEKETGTPHINTMHRNTATDNMSTAEKQTSTTVDVTAAYRGLIAPEHVPVTLSRGTCTAPPDRTDRETSPIKYLGTTTERATSPIRKRYVDKGISVTQADLMCPVDKFHRPGQGKQRVLSKITPKEEEAVTFVPMATIQETSSDEESTCTAVHSMKSVTDKQSGAHSVVHKERLWLTAPRLGNTTSKFSKVPVQTAPTSPHRPISTFSANGSAQTSSILCKVETGTSTPPVETEDKAMCTESFSVDGKITECISKLRTVSQRLEAQTTTFHTNTGSMSEPIYSRADTGKRESVITQATTAPVLCRQVAATPARRVEAEGIGPLPSILKRTRRLGGKPGDNESSYPFLARKELHSIDTGMVGSDTGFKSKARKQRLDITQLLHRPPGLGPPVPPTALHPMQGAHARLVSPSSRLGTLDEKPSQELPMRRRIETEGDTLSVKLRPEMPRMEHLLTSSSDTTPVGVSQEQRSRTKQERPTPTDNQGPTAEGHNNKALPESRLPRTLPAEKQTAVDGTAASEPSKRHSRVDAAKHREDRLKQLRQSGLSRSESTESSPESPRRTYERNRRLKKDSQC